MNSKMVHDTEDKIAYNFFESVINLRESIAEALMLALINVIIPTTSVIGCLWTITSCFIVFSLILPDLNPKIAPIILDHLPNAMVSVLNKEWI